MSRVMTDKQIYEAFVRVIRKQDGWRGYFGEEITEAEVLYWLARANAALKHA